LNEQNPNAKFGWTKFSDLSRAEFQARYLTLKPSHLPKATATYTPHLADVPDQWDWVKQGAVNKIKDQGQCGSCYIFSVVAAVEGAWKVSGHPLISLSEQQVLDCDNKDDHCNGGWMFNVYDYIKQAGGLELEKDYPYNAYSGKCKFDQSKVKATIAGYINITTTKNETTMAEYSYLNGPISIAMDANVLQDYHSGIISKGQCSDRYKDLNHAIAIVGQGSYTSFHKKYYYWVVRNSWGDQWGESGYFRIYKGENACGLAWVPTGAIVA